MALYYPSDSRSSPVWPGIVPVTHEVVQYGSVECAEVELQQSVDGGAPLVVFKRVQMVILWPAVHRHQVLHDGATVGTEREASYPTDTRYCMMARLWGQNGRPVIPPAPGTA